MVIVPFPSVKATFTCQLDRWRFRFDTLFNDYEGVWHFDLTDAQTNRVIGYGIPILLGVDMLAVFNLSIGTMVAADMSGRQLDAGPDDLGSRVIVGYYSEADIEALS
jgi:hypothetical protein